MEKTKERTMATKTVMVLAVSRNALLGMSWVENTNQMNARPNASSASMATA
jgi:hypothetical protein